MIIMLNRSRFFIADLLYAVLAMACIIAVYSALFGVFNGRISDISGNTAAPLSAADPSYIQERLSRLGFYDGVVTGVYDTATSEAVRRYQLYLGLDGSGKTDTVTLEALTVEPDNTYSEYDVYLLARLIYAENAGGSWFDMLKTGAEAVRRINSGAHPVTLAGVIFEHGAYASAYDGRIWNVPTDKTIRAARDALRGMLN
jgi:N-acetylmuramoyl-L-alanine amidase